MAEENQVMKELQGEAAQAQQIMKEPQRVTTKNPKKVEAGKGQTIIFLSRGLPFS